MVLGFSLPYSPGSPLATLRPTLSTRFIHLLNLALVLYDTTTSGGNTHVHIAAAPQMVLLYKFVCVLRALARTQNTHKLVLQRVVAAGDPAVLCYQHPQVMNCLWQSTNRVAKAEQIGRR